MSSGLWISLAALNGAVAVGMGAYAAHGLAEPSAAWARTASQYQAWHALGVLLLCALPPARPFAVARWAFLVGTVLFCGSLYALALGAPRGAASFAPFGGGTLILGWLAVAVGGLALARRRDSL